MIGSNARFKVSQDRDLALFSFLSEVASNSGRQRQSIVQITEAVTRIDTVTQSNAAGAENSAAISEELQQQALQMLQDTERLAKLCGLVTLDGDQEGGDGAVSVARGPVVPTKETSRGQRRLKYDLPRLCGKLRRGKTAAKKRVGFSRVQNISRWRVI